MSAPAATVAIIIATYNGSATIGRAIASALAEPEVTQVIVVDDASTDETIATVIRLDDGTGRLILLSQSPNAGPAAARNKAIERATADWIGVLDADDFFLPGRIATLLAEAEGAEMVADDMWQVSEDDIDGPRTALLGDALPAARWISFTDFVGSNLSQGKRQRGELGFIKPLMQRLLFIEHHLRYQETMRLGEDFELYARLLGLGARLRLIPYQGYVSVVRADSLSSRHSEHDLLQLRDCHIDLRGLALDATAQATLEQHRQSIDARLQWRLLILAVKQRNLTAALRCFRSPLRVQRFLVAQLWNECMGRALKKPA